jgi:DNA-3-methyladenine glycosylase
MTLRTKRIYEDLAPDDGYRVLVDRLWPRGVTKERAALDRWLKEVAPSPELRTWFDHRADRFTEFAQRYTAELDTNPAVAELRALLGDHPTVTLLYGARDAAVNHAVVLAGVLHGSA